MRLTIPRLAAIVCGVAILASAAPLLATPEHPANSFPTVLNNPRVDVLGDGKVVLNFDTTGEHKGLLTLNLSNDGSGYKGDWVLVVRYTDNTDPATGVEPPAHGHETADQHEAASAAGDTEHPHRDYVRYVNDGTLSGTIDAASLDLADGALLDFRAQLTITLGTVKFDGVSGNGFAELGRGLALVVNGAQR